MDKDVEEKIVAAMNKVNQGNGPWNTAVVAKLAGVDEGKVVDFCREKGIYRDGTGWFR